MALVMGQRAQEIVDRTVLAPGLLAGRQPQDAPFHAHGDARRNDIDVIRLRGYLIRDLGDGHDRGAGKDLREHAGVGGVEVLDEDKGHAGIGRQGVQELGERFEPARRCAYPDDRERQAGLSWTLVLYEWLVERLA